MARFQTKRIGGIFRLTVRRSYDHASESNVRLVLPPRKEAGLIDDDEARLLTFHSLPEGNRAESLIVFTKRL